MFFPKTDVTIMLYSSNVIDIYCYYNGVEKSKVGSTAFVKILNNGIFTIGEVHARQTVRFHLEVLLMKYVFTAVRYLHSRCKN
jgi:hypothetical protein